MPWTYSRYPVSMTRLPDAVREKAVDIANALVAEGYAEGNAIAIAIAQARRWAKRHGEDVDRQILDLIETLRLAYHAFRHVLDEQPARVLFQLRVDRDRMHQLIKCQAFLGDDLIFQNG